MKHLKPGEPVPEWAKKNLVRIRKLVHEKVFGDGQTYVVGNPEDETRFKDALTAAMDQAFDEGLLLAEDSITPKFDVTRDPNNKYCLIFEPLNDLAREMTDAINDK